MTALNGEDEVAGLCSDLIRIDSTNAGDNSGPGERAAAEYVAGKLAEVGLEPQILESDSNRANVIARIAGEDSSRDALLLHGHLDVVPFNADDWTHHPLSGEIADGCVWGRGAVDMKNMDAMILAVVRQRLSEGRRPPRDVVLAFTADEEAGGTYGAQWLADGHKDLFDGCTEAIGEVGGFSVSLDDARRLYLIEAAEKGIAWMRLTARGRAGHGSMLNSENAVTELAEAVGRIGRYEWPVRLTQTVRTFLTETSKALELELDLDDAEATVAKLGPLARMIGATLRNTANPTMLAGGYKANVIPQTATAHVDGRFLPGYEDEFFATVDELLGPNVTREFVYHDIAVETGFDGPLVRAMADALLAEDPGALAVPYTLSGGTDLKAFSRLGMRGFGFAPLKLPADLDFSGMFHGVDERVPVDSLRFGVRVLDRFLDAC
ncbi:acetylornithine deacetylase/succinyl-diaminopimelate desuccinylase-like protein [Streptosporangium album]|uniref:Acetylornithine deacetylase/succinyl-diaminopimelate desuccinylase-like protein n=1 Tax=Streptosporangium album TaxID=47479 RepID=A0A7W7W8T6_9ACTN|nr:M20/M25/M40 family metallo-hydrolase [Streptosporangium album]MBB4938667.1 acetylornithine deacetylase/succinyl-diaminopimelate desuccinylase-like protein [Streptosporangium album]